VFKGFVGGVLAGVVLLMGGVYFYFASGMAPAATTDPPMPYEKQVANKSLDAHIAKATIPPPAVPADEPNLVAGAKVYKDQCGVCHGLPNQPTPPIANGMFPHAPMLFTKHGVTDDPVGETYWKVVNGIRLTGMPGFKSTLTDTQLWQVTVLLAHADQLPDSAKQVLLQDAATALQAAAMPWPVKAVTSKN
jgi:thiosulfate dehydrogenase